MKFPTVTVCLVPLVASTLAVVAACKGASHQAAPGTPPASGSGSAATQLRSATNTTPTPAPSDTGSAAPATGSGSAAANSNAPTALSDPNPRAVEGAAMSVEEAGTMSINMAQKLAAAATAADGDCAKLGTAVIALKPDFVKMMELGKGFDANPTKKKAFDDQYAEKLQTLITPPMTAIMKCDSNADIKSFLEALR